MALLLSSLSPGRIDHSKSDEQQKKKWSGMIFKVRAQKLFLK